MEPLYLSVARAFIGIAEVPGAVSTPIIMRWAQDLGVPSWFDNDDKAWCAIFVNRVLMACQLPLSGTGYDLLRARSFLAWGRATPGDSDPPQGAILVFAREGGGHVGFCDGVRADAYRVLGGNQQNQVNHAWIAKARLLAARWPLAYTLPVTPMGTLGTPSNSGPLSTNEQ